MKSYKRREFEDVVGTKYTFCMSLRTKYRLTPNRFGFLFLLSGSVSKVRTRVSQETLLKKRGDMVAQTNQTDLPDAVTAAENLEALLEVG